MQLPTHLRRLRDRVGSLRSSSPAPVIHRSQPPSPDKEKARKDKKSKRASSVPARCADDEDDDFRCRGYRETRQFDSYEQRLVDNTISDGYHNATMQYPRGRKLSVPEIINSFPQPPRRPLRSRHAIPTSDSDHFCPTRPIRRSPNFMKPVPVPPVPTRRHLDSAGTPRADLAFALWYEEEVRQEQEEVFRAVAPALARRKSNSTHSSNSSASLHTSCGRQPRQLRRSKKGPPVASSASHSVQLQSASPARPSVDSRSRKLSISSVCSERSRRWFTPWKKTPTP